MASISSGSSSRGPAPPTTRVRRTSLAVAGARRFTLYNADLSPPSSPRQSSPSDLFGSFRGFGGPGTRSPGSPSGRGPGVGILGNPVFEESPDSSGAPTPTPRSPISASAVSPFDTRGAHFPSHFKNVYSRLAGHEEEDEGETNGQQQQQQRHPHPLSRQLSTDDDTEVPTPILARPQPPRRKSSAAPPRYQWLSPGNTGDEPGVDVRSARDEAAYGHLRGKTHVTVVDYVSDPDAEDMNVRVDFPGSRLASWLGSDEGKRPVDEQGKVQGVRWIHVTGLNWEVIKTLALKFQLHPLAVEDALRSSNSPRSKLDFYRNHLYLQILVHHVHAPDREALARAAAGLSVMEDECLETPEEEPVVKPRWWRPTPKGSIRLPEGVDAVFEPTMVKRKRGQPLDRDDSAAHRRVVDQLSAAYMLPIRKGILSIFMFRDGTLISLSAHQNHEVLEPIYARLEDEHSLLRRSGDVSMLCHALVDVCVDLAVEIIQAFEGEILKCESEVLVAAQLNLVRHLHVLQAQLARFRRQVMSLLYACCVIRDQDPQRAAAAGSLTLPRSERLSNAAATMAAGGTGAPGTGIGAGMGAGGMGAGGMGAGMAAGMGAGGVGMATSVGSDTNTSFPPVSTPAVGTGGLAPIIEPVPVSAGSLGRPSPHSPHHSSSVDSRVSASTPGIAAAPLGALGGMSPMPVAAGQGFFTPLARVYMNDVIDHLEMVVSNSEQMVGTCDHLTEYAFNVLSFHTNNSMERLSIVTVIFLPLTFISSFYGMNFEDFPSLENNVFYFWKIAAPLTVAFFFIFSYSYIQSAFDTFVRRVESHKGRRQGRGEDVGEKM